MPIFEKYNALFIHIPRTGGTNLERLLQLNCKWPETNIDKLFGVYQKDQKHFVLQHLTCQEILTHQLVPRERFDGLFKFTIIRNPYDRCASLYRYWQKQWESFEDFVRYLDTLDLNSHCCQNGHTHSHYHFLPQYQYIFSESGELLVDAICRFHRYVDDLKAIFHAIGYTAEKEFFDTHKQHMRKAYYFRLYDRTTRELVKKIYAKDFELLSLGSDDPFGESMMDDGSIPRPSPRFQLEDFGDEVVLYDFATTQMVYLNDTASLIWRLCDGQRNIADIKSLLQKAYPAASDQIEYDLRATLEQFVSYGAVELL